MAEIQVIFRKTGQPIVHNDIKATLWDEHITWHIHNENEDIKKVKIEFEKGDARYFPMKEPQTKEIVCRNTIVKDLPEWKGGEFEQTNANIWGVAPIYSSEERRRKDKYTVFGLDADGKEVCNLDPQIVNSDPNDP